MILNKVLASINTASIITNILSSVIHVTQNAAANNPNELLKPDTKTLDFKFLF